MSLENELKKWVASPAGKTRIAKERAQALKEGRTWGSHGRSGAISRKIVEQYAEDVISSILENLPASLRHSPTPITRASFENPVIKLNGDAFFVSIYFSPGAVKRASLIPSRYNGIENIAVHLSNGWSSRGAVRGSWHGEETWSRMEYAGDDFMREAIDAFNRSHLNATANLGPKYEV